MDAVIENARIASLTAGGKPVHQELVGCYYEEAVEAVPALKPFVEEYEEKNPLEKARRLLRQYNKGANPVPEQCSCHRAA